MKIITSVTIDSELLKEAKRKGISLSKVLDKALRKKLNFSDKVREEIDKFCKELKLSNKAKKKALRIYNKTIKDSKKARKIKNVPIKSLVASIIYVASNLCNERITQFQIAKVCNVSDVTIRRYYRLFCD